MSSAAEDKELRQRPDVVLRVLWRNWAIAFGAIVLPIVLGSFIPKVWLPFIVLAEVWGLGVSMRSRITESVSSCSLIIMLAMRSLAVTAIAMAGVVILCTDWLVPTVIHLKVYNSEIPFIACLISFPVCVIFSLISLYGGGSERYFRRCQQRHGYYAGDNIVATLYFRESRYQALILLVLSLLLGGVEYWYYFTRYINSNLNTPDRFFFNYMPLAIYLLSLFFMEGRYGGLRRLYGDLAKNSGIDRTHTLVRYLVFCGDELLLKENAGMQWDTPVQLKLGRTQSIGERQARTMFAEHTELEEFGMRYCFTNSGFIHGINVLHYAVFINPEQKSLFPGEDVWFNAYMLDRGLAENMLAPILANELFRIHTITMAWKTYDRKGKRLYPVRHYRPTFRFRDLQKWDVDYDDESWFAIASNNEDRRFYRLRKFWDKVTGVADKKQTDEAGQ